MNVLIYLTANETQPHNGNGIQKQEFKSPAEERLIRKMAKMALNGYEIGIQRKIKPADSIKSMADKIQDTVVTKHPLNADGLSSGESSCESTLKHGLNKSLEKGNVNESIHNIGDKIKDIIINKHPANIHNNSNGNVLSPPPPPLPNSPIPNYNVHSTPKSQSFKSNSIKKPSEFFPKNLNSSLDIKNLNNADKPQYSSGYSSSDDSCKDKFERNNSFTLRKNGFQQQVANGNNEVYDQENNKLKNQYSSTLQDKTKIFEKRDDVSIEAVSIESNVNKSNITRNGSPYNTNSLKKTNGFGNIINGNGNKVLKDDENVKKQVMSNNLHDNSLYTFKSVNGNNNNVQREKNGNTGQKISENCSGNGGEEQSNSEEVTVKRRQKKADKNDDGRRDSHIIARPLSTMTSVDVADGAYPVCHICDKAITR